MIEELEFILSEGKEKPPSASLALLGAALSLGKGGTEAELPETMRAALIVEIDEIIRYDRIPPGTTGSGLDSALARLYCTNEWGAACSRLS